MTDAEIDRLYPFQVVLPAAMYSGHNFRLAIAYSGPSLAPRGHVTMRGSEWLYVFCFSKRDEAEALRVVHRVDFEAGGLGVERREHHTYAGPDASHDERPLAGGAHR